MKVLLVDCLARGGDGRKATLDVLGVGPRAVAGILEREKIRYKLVTYEEFPRDPRRLSIYDVLMVSGMSVDRSAVLNVLKAWKSSANGLSILGGPIATSVFRDPALHNFNIIVWGESENTLPRLLQHLRRYPAEPQSLDYEELKNVKGLFFRVDGETLFTGHPPHTSRSQLDELIPSTNAVTHYREYWSLRVYVEVVRGCSNFLRPKIRLSEDKKCTECGACTSPALRDRLKCPENIPPGCGFCSIPKVYGPSRSRSIESIYREVKDLIKLGVTRIVLSASDFLDYGRDWIVDPEPLTDPVNPPPNLEAISKLLGRLTSINEVSSGEASILVENLKASLVDEDVGRVLGEYLKGTPVHIGCETGCEEHSKLIGRPSTPKQVLEACRILRKYGLRPYVYFIHGLPGQNWHTTRETVKLVRELARVGVEKLTVYRFSPLPESAFENFPPGKPANHDVKSRVIVRAVERANLESKESLIGKTIKCIIVKSKKSREDAVGYPLYHGPVVKIEKGRRYAGFLAEVKIVKAKGERVVEGEIVKVLKKLVRS